MWECGGRRGIYRSGEINGGYTWERGGIEFIWWYWDKI